MAATRGILYGPGAEMDFFTNTQMYGTVIGGNITVKSGAGIHYDEALNKFCILLWDDCSYRASVDTTWVKSTAGNAGH